MELKIKVQPTKVQGRTKEEVLSKIKGIPTFGSFGSYIRSYDQKFAIVYTAQKYNKKVVQKQKKDKTGKNITTSKVISQKYWEMHVYKFDLQLIDTLKLIINQTGNTFVISKRK